MALSLKGHPFLIPLALKILQVFLNCILILLSRSVAIILSMGILLRQAH